MRFLSFPSNSAPSRYFMPSFARLSGLVATFLATALLACDNPGPGGFCTAPRSIAVQLDVSDSLTGVGLADSAAGTAVSGGYQDSLHHFGSPPATTLWGGDRIGIYTVTVQRPAYRDWVKANVRVSQVGECGNVIPVDLVARLVHVP
jgi:hypothetical protein